VVHLIPVCNIHNHKERKKTWIFIIFLSQKRIKVCLQYNNNNNNNYYYYYYYYYYYLRVCPLQVLNLTMVTELDMCVTALQLTPASYL
jgi:hypothetical protein